MLKIWAIFIYTLTPKFPKPQNYENMKIELI